MDKVNEPARGVVGREIDDLRARSRTVIMATAGGDGLPEASYAPYAIDEAGHFYVFVSGLAQHTQNMHANPYVELLFIEPEEAAANLFARRRLVYQCRAEPIAREAPQWRARLDDLNRRAGPIVDTLRQLADFELFQLTPQSGRYVRGFGQAYRLHGQGLTKISRLGPADDNAGPIAP